MNILHKINQKLLNNNKHIIFIITHDEEYHQNVLFFKISFVDIAFYSYSARVYKSVEGETVVCVTCIIHALLTIGRKKADRELFPC